MAVEQIWVLFQSKCIKKGPCWKAIVLGEFLTLEYNY